MSLADRTSTLIDPLRARFARSAVPAQLADAARWLRGGLPAPWRRLLEADERQLGLLRVGDEVELRLSGGRDERVLGRLPLDDATVLADARARLDEGSAPRWLLLPAAKVLRRVLTLPAAAAPRLREVLAFELDRQTPFAADQVTYQGRVLGRDASGQQLQVELLVLPKSRLDDELAALGPLAEGLSGVDAIGDDGRRLGVNLLPDTRRGGRVDPGRRLNRILAITAAAALLLSLGLVLHNRSTALDALRARVEAATTEARSARLLRNELQSSVQAANFLAATRAARPTMLEALDELTRRIPEHTSADKLSIIDGKITVSGYSRAAPSLVGLLQASPMFANPALSGAVQTDVRTGRDRFTLTATLVQPPPQETPAAAPAPSSEPAPATAGAPGGAP